MTWGEFKEKMQQRGVTDGAPLREVLLIEHAFDDIAVKFFADGSVIVTGDVQ